MKFKTFIFSIFIFLTAFVMPGIFEAPAQAQEMAYQKYAVAKYVKTARDTVTLPGMSGSLRSGSITNQGPNVLRIFFSTSGGEALDSNRFFLLASGKTLKFNTRSNRIFRNAVADSCLSQVLIGAEIGSRLEQEHFTTENTEFAEEKSNDLVTKYFATEFTENTPARLRHSGREDIDNFATEFTENTPARLRHSGREDIDNFATEFSEKNYFSNSRYMFANSKRNWYPLLVRKQSQNFRS